MDIVTLAIAKSSDAVLQSQINTLKAIGRFLALWNSSTGLPTTNPASMPYTYKTGDYYIVNTVAEAGLSNYKPNGTTYSGTASTTVESGTVRTGDVYFYDGTNWSLQTNYNGFVPTAQGVAHAGEFLVVGNDGNVTTVSMQTWTGGSY